MRIQFLLVFMATFIGITQCMENHKHNNFAWSEIVNQHKVMHFLMHESTHCPEHITESFFENTNKTVWAYLKNVNQDTKNKLLKLILSRLQLTEPINYIGRDDYSRHRAALAGLIMAGAYADISYKSLSPFKLATMFEDFNMAVLLLDKKNDLLHLHENSLMLFTLTSSVELAHLYVDYGANSALKDEFGRSTLSNHAIARDSWKLIKFYLDRKQRVDEKDMFGRTPLGNLVAYSDDCHSRLELLKKTELLLDALLAHSHSEYLMQLNSALEELDNKIHKRNAPLLQKYIQDYHDKNYLHEDHHE